MAHGAALSPPPSYYPAFLDLGGRRALVLGGGTVACTKVRELTQAGAEVLLVAPEADPELRELASDGKVVWRQRKFRAADLEGVVLLIAATDSRAANARAARQARRRNILANAVDDPANCDFIAPALIRRGALTVAVSTAGASPAFARFVREKLEQVIREDYGQLLEAASEVRRQVRQRRLAVPAERWQAALAEAEARLRGGATQSAVRDGLALALGTADSDPEATGAPQSSSEALRPKLGTSKLSP